MPCSKILVAAIFTALLLTLPAYAQTQKVKVVQSFASAWDPAQASFCKDRGEFAKAGLDIEIINTRGGSENIQAVTTGGADIGYGVGTNAVLAAFMQGSPIKIIGSEFLGQNDTFFYVPADSPIKTIADLKGKIVSFPRPGGATESVLLSLKSEHNIDFKMVATGALDATFTQVMTKQVDVGWSIPPYELDKVESGEIRVLFAGDEAKALKNVTGRVNFARNDFLKSHRETAVKFLRVLEGCIDWSYAHQDESAKAYATLNKVDAAIAKKAISFYNRSTLAFGPVAGMNEVIKQAVDTKFIDKAPTDAQLKELMDIVYRTPSK